MVTEHFDLQYLQGKEVETWYCFIYYPRNVIYGFQKGVDHSRAWFSFDLYS